MLKPTPRFVLLAAAGIPFLLLATLVEGRLGVAAAVLVAFAWLLVLRLEVGALRRALELRATERPGARA